jgi:hypothetical protein
VDKYSREEIEDIAASALAEGDRNAPAPRRGFHKKDDELFYHYIVPFMNGEDLPNDAAQKFQSIPNGYFQERLAKEYEMIRKKPPKEYKKDEDDLYWESMNGQRNQIESDMIRSLYERIHHATSDLDKTLIGLSALSAEAGVKRISSIGASPDVFKVIFKRAQESSTDPVEFHMAMNEGIRGHKLDYRYSTDNIAFLLARGAHDYHNLADELKVKSPAGGLLKASRGVERVCARLIEDSDNPDTTQKVRDYMYNAAMFACLNGLDAEAYVAEQEKILRRQYENRYPREKAYSTMPPGLAGFIADVYDRHGPDSTQKIHNMTDVIKEFAATVVLPQIVPQEYTENKKDTDRLIQRAEVIAAAQLFGTLNMSDALDLSNNWHRAGNAISTEIRDLVGGDWHPLMDEFLTSVSCSTAKMYPEPEKGEQPKDVRLKIVPLTSHTQLKDESKDLSHCVGTGGYDMSCIRGDVHVLSIRSEDGNRCLATICVKPDLSLVNGQFYGHRNSLPCKEAQKAWDEFEGLVEKKKLNVNRVPGNGWGAVSPNPNISQLELAMGFKLEDAAQKVPLAAQHYRTKLKQVQEVPVRDNIAGHMDLHQQRLENRRSVKTYNVPDLSPPHFAKALKEREHLLREEDREVYAPAHQQDEDNKPVSAGHQRKLMDRVADSVSYILRS